MILQRARVIKNAFPEATGAEPRATTTPAEARARRVTAEILVARSEAARILEGARAEAATMMTAAAANAADEARAQEVARLAAGFLALRDEEARRVERDVERTIEIAVILAERLIGEAIRIEPARISALAAAAIHEARGARRVRIDACPDDVAALEEALGGVGPIADVHPDATLRRGSLVVHTELGRVDACLEPQLARLAIALREALA